MKFIIPAACSFSKNLAIIDVLMQFMGLKKTFTKGKIEAGCDEAGRGCLAGPVVAGAVILSKNFTHPLLNDSKKMTDKQREALFPIIKQEAIAWGVGFVDHLEIDKINILNASFEAMHRAIRDMNRRPELLDRKSVV